MFQMNPVNILIINEQNLPNFNLHYLISFNNKEITQNARSKKVSSYLNQRGCNF